MVSWPKQHILSAFHSGAMSFVKDHKQVPNKEGGNKNDKRL